MPFTPRKKKKIASLIYLPGGLMAKINPEEMEQLTYYHYFYHLEFSGTLLGFDDYVSMWYPCHSIYLHSFFFPSDGADT